MLAPRSLVLLVSLLSLTLGACSGTSSSDEGLETDGGEEEQGPLVLACPEGLATAVVGLEYSFDLKTLASGGSGIYSDWQINQYPIGLELDAATGIFSGIPIVEQEHVVELRVSDYQTGETDTESCALRVNEPLSAQAILDSPGRCVPYTASKAELLELLVGGDETEIDCSLAQDPDLFCPHGEGKGAMPTGIEFDAESCTHAGALATEVRGTWVWMVRLEQSGYVTSVPFCAESDAPSYHEIIVMEGTDEVSELLPVRFDYDPAQEVAFGSSYLWRIQDPDCIEDPGSCTSYGVSYTLGCSPFDPPYEVDSDLSATGINHELALEGPVPAPEFVERPWVVNLDLSYCTAQNATGCNNPTQNAQTRYHLAIIGAPELE